MLVSTRAGNWVEKVVIGRYICAPVYLCCIVGALAVKSRWLGSAYRDSSFLAVDMCIYIPFFFNTCWVFGVIFFVCFFFPSFQSNKSPVHNALLSWLQLLEMAVDILGRKRSGSKWATLHVDDAADVLGVPITQVSTLTRNGSRLIILLLVTVH